MPSAMPVGKAVFASFRSDIKTERVQALGAYLRQVVAKAPEASDAQRTIAAFLDLRNE